MRRDEPGEDSTVCAEAMSRKTRSRRALWLCLFGVVLAFVVWWGVSQFDSHDLAIILYGKCTCNATGAIGSLRTIASVQVQFREGDREGDGFDDYASSLAELSHAGLIDNVLGAGVKGGYIFTLSGGTDDWKASATPVSEKTGTRNFIVCSDGVVRLSRKGLADCNSEAIE